MSDRASRKKQITERRQSQILNAAMEVFSKKGYSAATIPEIAKLAGVAAGTIYIYYPSKRDLFIALMRKLGQSGAIPNVIENMPVAGFPVIFKGILQNKLSIARNANISSVISLWSDILREPELKAQLMQQVFQPVMSQMEEFYRNRMDAGEFRQLDPAIVARAVISMVVGLVVLNIFEGGQNSIDSLNREKLADEVIDILLNGLAKSGKNEDGNTT